MLREPIPENSEAAIKNIADLLASFLKLSIEALASNLAALLPHSILFKDIKSTKPIIKNFILIILVCLWKFSQKDITFQHVLKYFAENKNNDYHIGSSYLLFSIVAYYAIHHVIHVFLIPCFYVIYGLCLLENCNKRKEILSDAIKSYPIAQSHKSAIHNANIVKMNDTFSCTIDLFPLWISVWFDLETIRVFVSCLLLS